MVAERSRPLILAADDDAELLDMIVEQLETGPWDIIRANNGQNALHQALEHQPDLVLLDVMMPKLSGWEVCREIRASEELGDIGVIMLTAIGHTLNELTSPLYGADAHIDKPFDFEELEETIREVLAKRGAPGFE